MKKFFSILCAFAIVLSVTAAPISKKDVLAKKDVKKELRVANQAVKAPAKAVNFKSMDKKVATKATKTFTAFENGNFAEQKATVAKAPKAKKEVIDVIISEDVDWEDNCAAAGWWQVQAEDDTYYVTLSNMYAEEAAGEYAWEDLDPEYCAIWYEECGENLAFFTDGSCTVSVSEEEVIVEGTFSCEDGNTYHVKLIAAAPEPVEIPEGGEFECDEISFSFFSSDNDAYYRLNIEEIDATFYFDIVVEEGLTDVEPGKTYGLADMLEDYSYAYVGDAKILYSEASFVKNLNEDGSGDIQAIVLDADGNTWTLHYAIPATPVAESFETITADVTYSSEPYWFWTLYTFEAADEANAIILQLLPDDGIYGTWEAGTDITGIVTPLNGVESEIYSGEVVIAATAEGFKITGKVLCWNNIEYTLDLTYIVPAATREVEFTLGNLEANVFNGGWQLSGFNEDETQYVSIAAYADEVSGHYTEAELAADYCFIYTDLEFDEEGNLVSGTEFDMLKADLNVVFDEEARTMVITGKFRAQNAADETDIPEFTLNLSGAAPEIQVEEVEFAMKNMTATFTETYWDLKGQDEETGYFLEIRSLSAEIAGQYTEANLDDYWSYVGVGDGVYFDLNKANIVVSYENEVLAIQGTMVFVEASSSDTIFATIDVAGVESAPVDCSEYDAEEGNDFIHDFAEFGVYGDEEAENIWYLVGEETTGEYIVVKLIADELDYGEYAFAAESEAPYAEAGALDLNLGQVTGSFAGYVTATGISIPLWAMKEGKVVINEDNTVTVDAVNCAGAKIQCHLGTAEEGIENVVLTEDVKKVVVDGVLYIVRDGKMFNVQGAQVR